MTTTITTNYGQNPAAQARIASRTLLVTKREIRSNLTTPFFPLTAEMEAFLAAHQQNGMNIQESISDDLTTETRIFSWSFPITQTAADFSFMMLANPAFSNFIQDCDAYCDANGIQRPDMTFEVIDPSGTVINSGALTGLFR